MGSVTPTVALITFGLILLISMIVALFMGSYESFSVSAFHSFIVILAGLGVFVTFIFYYSVVELQQSQEELASITLLSKINSALAIDLLNTIQESSTIIPDFVSSIHPLLDNNTTPDPVTAETTMQRNILSYRIFTSWQEVLFSKKFLPKNADSHVCHITLFLQQANSSQLEDMWKLNRINFTPNAMVLGDLLFQYARNISLQSPNVYTTAAHEFLQDPIYTKLVNR